MNGQLPDGWRWARLGEVMLDSRNGIYKPDAFYGTGTPILKMYNIGRLNGEWDLGRVDLITLDDDERTLYRLNRGDILLNRVNSNVLVGKCAVVDSTTEGAVFESKNIRLRLDTSCAEPSFVAAYLNSQGGRSQIEQRRKQIVGQATINRSDLESLLIPLPPLAEQRRIAAFLTEQLAAVDRARAACEAQLAAARRLPEAYLRTAFESQRNRPSSQKLRDISELLPARSIALNGDLEAIAITTACLTEWGFDERGVKKSRMWAKDACDCVVSNGEVLVARSNTPELVGRASIYGGQVAGAVATDLTIRIQPNSCDGAYLAAYLSYLYLTGYWKERAGGASGSMKKITRTQILNLDVPLPDQSTQEMLSEQLDALMASVRSLVAGLSEQLAAIARLPGAFLQRAFEEEL